MTDLDEGGVHADGETLVVSAGDALLAGEADVAGEPGPGPAPRALIARGSPSEECSAGVAAAGWK